MRRGSSPANLLEEVVEERRQRPVRPVVVAFAPAGDALVGVDRDNDARPVGVAAHEDAQAGDPHGVNVPSVLSEGSSQVSNGALKPQLRAAAEPSLEVDGFVHGAGLVGPAVVGRHVGDIAPARIFGDLLLDDVDAEARRVRHRQMAVDDLKDGRHHLVAPGQSNSIRSSMSAFGIVAMTCSAANSATGPSEPECGAMVM